MAKKDKPGLTQAGDKDARAVTFMMERVAGKTIKEIARAYNCHPDTVIKYIGRARERALVTGHAKTLIEDRLLPLALAVVEQQLLEGSLEAAQDVLYGLGILQKNATIKHQTADGETLDAFREQYLLKRAAAVEATILPPAPPALPPLPETPPEVNSGPPGPPLTSAPHVQDEPSERWVSDLRHEGDEDPDE